MGNFISKYSLTEFNDVVPVDYIEDIDHLYIDAFSEEYGGLFKIQVIKYRNWKEILSEMIKIMNKYDEKMCPIEFYQKSKKMKVKILDHIVFHRKKSKSHNHHKYYPAFEISVNGVEYEIKSL